ncbi:MAG: hypothetical protein JW709_12210 [Sedimentisphaerales bacterium]|nr:hypothetical protein [Sedimentisphaerales bacterium]
MSTISSVSGTSDLASAKLEQTLSSDDFLQIMITELTHQDPFDPVKNETLLNQMSSIQQIESQQNMSKSFKTLVSNFDQLLKRDELSTAGKMVGQIISGKNLSGTDVYGKVLAVNVSENDIILELDTGDKVKMSDLTRMGGQNSADVIGKMVAGRTINGDNVVGRIESLLVDKNQILLSVSTRDLNGEETLVEMPMNNATLVGKDNVDTMLGCNVEGYAEMNGQLQKVKGLVVSYQLLADDQVVLNIVGENANYELPLTEVTRVYISASN